MEALTKENFWDEMSQKYPKAIHHFLNWIDEYKKTNRWSTLFNNEFEGDRAPEYLPEYHELPVAMQFGIFLQYMSETSKERLEHYRVWNPLVNLTAYQSDIKRIIKRYLLFSNDLEGRL